MNDIRARFEEIWPVPAGVYWCADLGEYMRKDVSNKFLLPVCVEYDARLETFTRCQETTVLVVGITEELVRELENASPWIHDSNQYCFAADVVNRAKQIMEQKK